MNLDTALQNMLFKSTPTELEDLAWCATRQRPDTISRFQSAFNWTISQCEEFLDNITEAYELLIRS